MAFLWFSYDLTLNRTIGPSALVGTWNTGTFAHLLQDLDVQVDVMDQAMSSTSVMSTPLGEVEGLMQQVADEHGLEMDLELGDAAVATGAPTESVVQVQQDDLTQRLARLRGSVP
jgi:charged multivesicular body protein 1